MTWPLPIPPEDALAVAFAVALAFGVGILIEHPPARRVSVSKLMQTYRRDWMREFVTRQPRIFDATIIDSLRQGTAFFASACLIAIGAGLALIGNPGQLQGLAGLSATMPVAVKLVLVLAFLANALLKFLWAHRLFGYCSVLMAAVPNDPGDAACHTIAQKAAAINITAARGFNRGLRSIYFAVAAMGWLVGPLALAGASVLAAAVMIRREFFSESRRVLTG
jgi:uncharacterized membrane protein